MKTKLNDLLKRMVITNKRIFKHHRRTLFLDECDKRDEKLKIFSEYYISTPQNRILDKLKMIIRQSV